MPADALASQIFYYIYMYQDINKMPWGVMCDISLSLNYELLFILL